MTDIVQHLRHTYHLDTVQPEHPIRRAVEEIERLRRTVAAAGRAIADAQQQIAALAAAPSVPVEHDGPGGVVTAMMESNVDAYWRGYGDALDDALREGMQWAINRQAEQKGVEAARIDWPATAAPADRLEPRGCPLPGACSCVDAQLSPTVDAALLVDNLRTLVARMARALKRAGDADTADVAIDFLQRHGLEGSPLRGAASPPSAAPMTSLMTDAARDVLAERRHHFEIEGWPPKHDDRHQGGDMAIAAACYALADRQTGIDLRWLWRWAGWATSRWEPKENQRDYLVRAAALLLAEIEQIDRAADAAARRDA